MMMRRPSPFVLACLCILFATPSWGRSPKPSGPPQYAYISTGSGGQIYSVDMNPQSATYGQVTLLLSTAGANYQGLVVGPDNAPADNTGNSPITYLLYACDVNGVNGYIVRFNPNNPPNQNGPMDTVYTGSAVQCGRFTNTGDLIVTAMAAGSGILEITGTLGKHLADVGFPAAGPNSFGSSQVQNTSTGQFGRGIAQKNSGGLLTVNVIDNDVLLTPYVGSGSFSGPPSVFIGSSNLLPMPYGIAKKSNGEVYISNQSGTSSNIVHYGALGGGGDVCVSSSAFNKYTPAFMQMSASDMLYVAGAGSSSGTVFTVDTTNNCSTTQLPNSVKLPPLVGIALPPTIATQTHTFKGTGTDSYLFNFGFAAFQFTSASMSRCTLSVTAEALNPGSVTALINADSLDLPDGGMPGVDLGRDGFETAFDLAAGAGCLTDPAAGNGELVSVYVDNAFVTNPRVLACDTNPTTCDLVESFGDYPLSSVLPGDPVYTGRDGASRHFLVNASTTNISEPGAFCGFQSPLSNLLYPPAAIAGTFGSGQSLSVKFKLADLSQNGTCQNGPYIPDAKALISVAQVCTPTAPNPLPSPDSTCFPVGQYPVAPSAQNLVDLAAEGSSSPVQPLFKSGNNQYQFSLSLNGYNPGIYALTVTFLTSNETQKTILFQVK
jgi:hypothetical protein